MSGPKPDKRMIEPFAPPVRLQCLPGARVHLAPNALAVQNLLHLHQGIGVDADAREMIIPSGVLAESCEREPRRASIAAATCEPLKQIFHNTPATRESRLRPFAIEFWKWSL